MQASPVAVKLRSRAAVYYNSLTKRKLFQWFTPAGSCLHHICKSGRAANVLSMVLLENLISAYYCPLEIIVRTRKSLCDWGAGGSARSWTGFGLVSKSHYFIFLGLEACVCACPLFLLRLHQRRHFSEQACMLLFLQFMISNDQVGHFKAGFLNTTSGQMWTSVLTHLNELWMHCMLLSGLCSCPHNPEPLKCSIINITVAETPTRWDHVSLIIPDLTAHSRVGPNCFSVKEKTHSSSVSFSFSLKLCQIKTFNFNLIWSVATAKWSDFHKQIENGKSAPPEMI